MTNADVCLRIREARDILSERCFLHFPCLSDPARRASLCLKLSLLFIHVIVVGVLFLFDSALVEKTRKEPWYTALYLVLFIATLVQYFFTSGSSPGYVEDAMRAGNETHSAYVLPPRMSKQSASRENGSLLPLTDYHQLGRNVARMNSSSWMKLVMELYPPGSSNRNWTCSYCNIVQPPRSKHCHDCEKCVLQFDHHCIWLGTCIGQRNHCRFWWYIFEETTLCIWTIILYVSYLGLNSRKPWWKETIAIVLLLILIFSLIFLLLLLIFHSYLILTNQTTYELVRRRRISYLRGIPEKVHPFSQGICRNLYTFYCSFNSSYLMEPVPTMEELEAKAKPYTCLDIVSCRCC